MDLCMDVSFMCDCGEMVGDTVTVQDPDFTAERSKDSQTQSVQEVCCPHCEKEHFVLVVNSFSGAECFLNGYDQEIQYDMPYYPEDESEELLWSVGNKNNFTTFQEHLVSVRALLATPVPHDAKFSLLVMLYGHVVSAIEGYLSGTFIQRVTNSEALIRKLVETDPELAKRTFSLKEIFEKQSNLKITVASYLKELIFHDLRKVKPMYNDVLGHDFKDIAWLFKAVIIRHDCVHRAGYDKEGKAINISDDILLELLDNAEDLVKSVQETVEKIEVSDSFPF
jgi:hypothetical protein